MPPKRALALREPRLGDEALQRLDERQPLYRVHECVFGVLAQGSEPVELRLWEQASFVLGRRGALHPDTVLAPKLACVKPT